VGGPSGDVNVGAGGSAGKNCVRVGDAERERWVVAEVVQMRAEEECPTAVHAARRPRDVCVQ